MSLVIIAIVGFGVWAFWPNKGIDVALQMSPSPTEYPAVSETPVFTATATPSPKRTATPRVSPTASPTPLGQGGEGPRPSRTPLFATMTSVNGSNQYGVAAVTAVTASDNDQAVVSFNMNGGPIGVYQDASIVNGTCAHIGSPVYALQPLFNGSSTTTLAIDFLDISQAQSSLAIVVYNPEGRSQFPYACGQLR
jgi:hypothetical protein